MLLVVHRESQELGAQYFGAVLRHFTAHRAPVEF